MNSLRLLYVNLSVSVEGDFLFNDLLNTGLKIRLEFTPIWKGYLPTGERKKNKEKYAPTSDITPTLCCSIIKRKQPGVYITRDHADTQVTDK